MSSSSILLTVLLTFIVIFSSLSCDARSALPVWHRCVGDLYICVRQNMSVSLKLSLSLVLSLALALFLCSFLSPAMFELLRDFLSHPLVKRATFEVFYSYSLSMRKKAGIYIYI